MLPENLNFLHYTKDYFMAHVRELRNDKINFSKLKKYKIFVKGIEVLLTHSNDEDMEKLFKRAMKYKLIEVEGEK